MTSKSKNLKVRKQNKIRNEKCYMGIPKKLIRSKFNLKMTPPQEQQIKKDKKIYKCKLSRVNSKKLFWPNSNLKNSHISKKDQRKKKSL